MIAAHDVLKTCVMKISLLRIQGGKLLIKLSPLLEMKVY